MKNIFTIVAMLFLFSTGTHAQFTYPNEVCSSAIPLQLSNYSHLYDTLWLNTEYADPGISTVPYCNGSNIVKRDLWYSFTATDTAVEFINRTLPGGSVSCQIFSGDCNNLASIGCYSSLSGTIGGLIIGQQYYLRAFYNPNSDFPNFNVNLFSKPANDDCSGALLLPVLDANTSHGLGERFTNAQATRTTTACNAAAPGWSSTIKDVWYKFVATASRHSIFIQTSSTASEAIIYQEAGGVFTSIASYNFFGSTEIKDLTNLVPGNVYYIRFGAVSTQQFSIGVFANAPTNDECAGADTVLMSNSFNCEKNFTVSKRITASTSTTPCTAASITKDVWFIFQATATAITVRATEQSVVRMGLLQGSCGALTCLFSTSNDEFTQTGLTIGNYYYLQVGGSGEEYPVAICITPAISNDECSGASEIAIKPYGTLRNTAGYLGNATPSMPRCNGSGSANDVWYRFTATDTAHLVTIDGADRFQILNGTCGNLNPVYCGGSVTQPLNAIDQTEKVSGLIPGTAYFLRVYSGLSVTMFTIDINSLPVNDECAGAKLLQPQQSLEYEPVLNNGILQASQTMAPCSTASFSNDIWYKFDAPSSSATILNHVVSTIGTINSLGLELYSGGCGSLTSMACIPQGTSVLHRVQNFSNLIAGNTYYIRQYGNITDNTISIITAPANDDITGAIRLYPSPSAVQTMPSYSNHAASKRFGKICTSSAVNMEHDTWFYFVAEATSHTVSTTNGNSFWEEEALAGYRLEAFRGFGQDSLSLAPKLLSCATNTLALSNLTIGDTVYIRVGALSAGATNIFTVKVSNTLNMDEPAGAVLLSRRNVFEYKVNTTGATQSLPSSGCVVADFPDDDVWFKFTAAADVKRIVAGRESTDISLQLFSGTAGNLTPVLCTNNIMVLPATLTNGNLYYLRAYTKVNTTRGDFRIGLFGEDDLYANSCNQPELNLGPNLVLNSRFEMEEAFVAGNVSTNIAVPGKRLAAGWWGASSSTPDTWSGDHPIGGLGYVTATSGYGENKIPRSGQRMLGILNYGGWHEYVTGKLTQPLTKGKTYFVSFYISFAEGYSNHAFKIGALLNNDSIHGIGTQTLNITPQVGTLPGSSIDAKTKWYNVCGYLTADDAYAFITIGNFGDARIYSADPAKPTYMFIDDVVVAEVTGSVVPLTLLEFRGRMNAQHQSELTWVTASETNTNRFEVEWRTGTGNFSKIGSLPAAGNSSTNQHYQFIHQKPLAGYNYYRLKMFDTDGRFSYSPVVRTGTAGNGIKLSVYPNPVSDILTVSASVEKTSMVFFQIIDSYGRTVASKQRLLQKGSNSFSWILATLAAGNYYIVLSNNGLSTLMITKN